jgi:uncharacterized membrane protein YeiH
MLLYVLDLLGVAVFAVSGALAAGRRHLDLLGVGVLAITTAIGGGTLRDVLLDRHPIFWIEDPAYLVVILAAAGATVLWVRRREPPERALGVADAFGLGLFALSGAQIAQEAGLSPLLVVLMATMTGSAGGVLRDVLANVTPLLIRPGELYATTCIVGTAVYLGLEGMGMARPAAGVFGAAVVIGLRLAAMRWGLHLPAFRLPDAR